MQASRDFFAGLGALAYSLAKADDTFSADEVNNVGKTFLNSFGHTVMNTQGLRAVAMLESLAMEGAGTDAAYQKALQHFSLDAREFHRLKPEIFQILDKLSAADANICEAERALIERFRQEAEKLA